MSVERVHLDLQSALLYPASRSRSATWRSMHRRQSPAAGRPVQEQFAPAAARMLLTASSVSARILLSAGLLLARASCAHPHARRLHRSISTRRYYRARLVGQRKQLTRTHEINTNIMHGGAVSAAFLVAKIQMIFIVVFRQRIKVCS